MKASSLMAAVCTAALCLGFLAMPAAAEMKVKQQPKPIRCISVKEPKCQVAQSFCTKVNECGNGCIKWSTCIKSFF